MAGSRRTWDSLQRDAVRYGLAGVLNTVVGFGIIAILDLGLGVNRHLANLIGYAIGLVVAFTLNRRYVFNDRGDNRSAGRFLIAFLAAFFANQLCLAAAAAVLPDEPGYGAAAQAAGILTYSVLMFWLCRTWVFAPTSSDDQRAIRRR